jgi:hypothetical protein
MCSLPEIKTRNVCELGGQREGNWTSKQLSAHCHLTAKHSLKYREPDTEVTRRKKNGKGIKIYQSQ